MNSDIILAMKEYLARQPKEGTYSHRHKAKPLNYWQHMDYLVLFGDDYAAAYAFYYRDAFTGGD